MLSFFPMKVIAYILLASYVSAWFNLVSFNFQCFFYVLIKLGLPVYRRFFRNEGGSSYRHTCMLSQKIFICNIPAEVRDVSRVCSYESHLLHILNRG